MIINPASGAGPEPHDLQAGPPWPGFAVRGHHSFRTIARDASASREAPHTAKGSRTLQPPQRIIRVAFGFVLRPQRTAVAQTFDDAKHMIIV